MGACESEPGCARDGQLSPLPPEVSTGAGRCLQEVGRCLCSPLLGPSFHVDPAPSGRDRRAPEGSSPEGGAGGGVCERVSSSGRSRAPGGRRGRRHIRRCWVLHKAAAAAVCLRQQIWAILRYRSGCSNAPERPWAPRTGGTSCRLVARRWTGARTTTPSCLPSPSSTIRCGSRERGWQEGRREGAVPMRRRAWKLDVRCVYRSHSRSRARVDPRPLL